MSKKSSGSAKANPKPASNPESLSAGNKPRKFKAGSELSGKIK